MRTADRISEAELNAYVDGQLDMAGRIEVEEHLANNPDVAARVMADLHMRDTLRLALPTTRNDVPLQTLAWARKVEKALSSRRISRQIQRLAASVAIFALGWSAHLGWNELTRAPDQRKMMAEVERIGDALDIRLPRVPDGWQILSAVKTQTANGPGVQITFRTPEFGRLSLLARDTSDIDLILPTVHAEQPGRPTVEWQMISDRYYLTAKLGEKPLELAALELYQTLY